MLDNLWYSSISQFWFNNLSDKIDLLSKITQMNYESLIKTIY